jgi:hypothetical protein
MSARERESERAREWESCMLYETCDEVYGE